ncbi:MAG TPA: MupA/Atu3671 family FMN-dependent luciferase-like monooxygenase [Pyrinomonadaceae bacterium]|jgi:natural product biosynthesis luciferase-like monooxygenase protein
MIGHRQMFPPVDAQTLVELLRRRAEQQPHQKAYTFLTGREGESVTLTYQELDERARAVAAALQSRSQAGDRVILLYPPGLEFVAAFFGCLYAGTVAVPAYPPRMNRSFNRLLSIIGDAQPRLALTTTPILSKVEALLNEPSTGLHLEGLGWLDTDTTGVDGAQDWRASEITTERLAFLQYTSGSTGKPKGVMLTHGNLLHNAKLVYYGVNHQPGDRYVSWLPTFHDMGFMAGVLQPLYGGFEVILMSPVTFLQSPFRWLQAISDYRATTSGGPSFAYDLCAQKITAEQRATLDLSSWSVAFNGAEPIRRDTLERFTQVFEPCGFRYETFYPCYGLAEATLIVSGGGKAAPPVVKTVQARPLERHVVIEASANDDEPRRALVGCGVALPEQEVAIVHPELHTACAPGEVGEIWVSGPSIAQGYWNNPAETERIFQARIVNRGGVRFLRTGDLGFMQEDGELFVTGRLKDVIIIRGLNHYPQDIELTVEQCDPALRPGCGAAFAVDVEGVERLVIVQEVDSRQCRDSEELIKSIRRAVSEEHELQPFAVVLIKPKSIPKTSSGKIQRHACRTGFLTNTLSVISEWRALAEEEVAAYSDRTLTDAESLEEWLRMELSAKLRIDPQQIDVDEPVMRYGLDSLTAIELAHRIETSLGINLPQAILLESPSISQLAAQVRSLPDSSAQGCVLSAAPQTTGTHKLSHGQQALWFLHQMSPESAAYNLASAWRVHGEVDVDAMERAFEALVRRHAALRTCFTTLDGKPVQQVLETVEFKLHWEDASGWTESALNERLAEEIHRPFDLEQAPLLRVRLFARNISEHVLLLSAHHIISDFWSLSVLMRELEKLYTAEKTGMDEALAPPALQYSDYTRWQDELLAGAEGERLWDYWRKQLAGELPVLNLPEDHPRPALQTTVGAAHTFRVDREVTRALKALAQESGATLYMVLLASFQVLLHRYTGQRDIIVGSPVSGRQQAALAGLVGYFVNPLPLRADMSGDPVFRQFIAQVRQTVLSAFKHQEYPFPLLVERLQPERDPSRSPLFQVLFTLQKTPAHNEHSLGPLALGESGTKTKLADLLLEAVTPEQRVAQFDLSLTLAEDADCLLASFQYNTDLFDRSTISRMSDHFCVMLESITENPDKRISELEILTGRERRQLLEEWNDTALEVDGASCIHQLFEAQAERTPEATALVFEDEQLTFRELNERANQLAHYLKGLGVCAESLVGICVERSAAMVTGLLGILKAGAAYVPIDPTYPRERIAFTLTDAGVCVLVTQESLRAILPEHQARLVCLDSDWPEIAQESTANAQTQVASDHLAYVIYTSGSTGKPKGVMIEHASVVNFFAGMDGSVGCGPEDTMLAVTSISFDISVLELLWTLTRGARVVVLSEEASHGLKQQRPRRATRERPLGFSLFYFASADDNGVEDKYRLLLEGAKYADAHGFEAVWTPERHFHAFGGLYPNPAVTGAALSALTQHVSIRAGSVVLPLHNPIRVAEEWALVDNLSRGRVGLSFASGWHADDFVFFPEHYADRKELMYRGIETVQRLWRGETVKARGGAGNEVEVRLFPQPVQPTLPIWITAAGVPETFTKAGEIRANVLTHLLGQSLEDVAEKIKLYRESLARHGHDPQQGRVTLMLHTYLDSDQNRVREKVRLPFTNYLRTSVGLIANLARSLNLSLDLKAMSARDMDDLLAHAFDRYFETSALFGTPDSCRAMIDRVKEMGVDEVACLVDFGIDVDSSLAGLRHLDALRESSSRPHESADYSLAAQAVRYRATMLQCTPSMMQMLSLNADVMESLGTLRVLMLGGEALPPSLARQMKSTLPCRLLNMYGPTETTIWSMVHEVGVVESTVPIGRPIANTQIYILDAAGQPTPTGVAGELCIGGRGLARGYLNRPELTEERFIPDRFAHMQLARGGLQKLPASSEAHFEIEPYQTTADFLKPQPPKGNGHGNGHAANKARLYKTGDLARFRPDGSLEFLGRMDHQVKIRGFRIELGEIEAVLAEHQGVREAVVVAREDVPGDKRLVAYVVPEGEDAPSAKELRTFLKERLPEYMVPAHFVTLEALPWTSNGKINRQALPSVAGNGADHRAEYVAPQTGLERTIARIWQQVLHVEKVGVHDNFFDLGGQSLLMAQAHSQLRAALDVKELPLIKLLEHPTVSALARHLSQAENEPATFKQSQARASKHREGLLRQRQTVLMSRSKVL